jgi:hypothetical protein
MKNTLLIVLFSLLFIQCKNENDTKIAKNQVGKLNKTTKIEDLDKIFKNDSLAKLPENADVFYEYKVYNKSGIHLLTIKPKFKGDSVIGIDNIQVYSDLYKTEKGLSSASTFQDISNNYSINKIEPTFTSAIVFVDEFNATIALDKTDLRLAEFDMSKIEKGQVPDMARIKFITIWFD